MGVADVSPAKTLRHGVEPPSVVRMRYEEPSDGSAAGAV